MEKVTPQNPPLVPKPIAMKQYIALLSQVGTAHPTYVIMKNTLGQIAWARADTGKYQGTLSGAFPADTTWLNGAIHNIDATETTLNVAFKRISDNVIEIQTGTSGDLLDGLLTSQPIEIRVYTPQ